MRRPPDPPTSSLALRRELGRWDLTAIGVNQVIGGAVFAQPSLYAASVGGWSPWLVAAVGLASMLIALSFAEVSSRFDATGGPYLYTRAAFGRFAAFEVGWMLWFTRAASWAAVINVLATAVAFSAPALASGWPRAAFIASIIVAIAAINIRGIRQSSLVLNVLTVGKLLPLVVFAAVGIFSVDSALLVPERAPTFAELSSTGLLLVFAFGGYEVIPVPAGEARDPRRAVPFALVMTIVIVTIVMTVVQVVAVGTLPGLAASKTPLADASLLFMGGAGAALLTLGAVLSMMGNNMGQALSGSRNLYALAEQGDLRGCSGEFIRSSEHPSTPSSSPRQCPWYWRCQVDTPIWRWSARSVGCWSTSRPALRRSGYDRRCSPDRSSRRPSSCRSAPSFLPLRSRSRWPCWLARGASSWSRASSRSSLGGSCI